MSCRITKRVSVFLGVAWLFLLFFVIIVCAANIETGGVQPGAMAFIFPGTLPVALGVTALVLIAVWTVGNLVQRAG